MEQYHTPTSERVPHGHTWGTSGTTASDGGAPAPGRGHPVHAWKAKTAGATCFLFLALLLPLAPWRAPAATITNYLAFRVAPGPQWDQQSIAINVGDTIVWVNQQAAPPTNYVESYGGQWRGALPNPGDSFAFTFTNAGFYAYRTGLLVSPDEGFSVVAGTITVSDWTDAPPAVTINSPMDGALLPAAWFLHGSLGVSRLVEALWRTLTISSRSSISRIQT